MFNDMGHNTLREEWYYEHLQIRGWLTEVILPPEYLENLFVMFNDLGHNTLREEWYYEHLQIYPMWEVDNELVFSVVVPMLSPTLYLY